MDGSINASGGGAETSATRPLEESFIGARYYTHRTPGNFKDFCGGSIDEVRLYDRALLPLEVKALYNGEIPNPQ